MDKTRSVLSNLFPLLMTAVVILAILLSPGAGMMQVPIVTLAMAPLLAHVVALARRSDGPGLEGVLLFPTILSAFQNVYLLPIADRLADTQLQLLIVVNFVFSALMLACFHLAGGYSRLGPSAQRLVGMAYWCLAGSALWGLLMMAAHGNDPMAAFASLRNVSAPFLFFLIGTLASTWTTPARYGRLLTGLTVAVVVFGFWEYLVPNFWHDAGLEVLWTKKDIPIDRFTHLPANFYSSEMIGGEQLRRMAGPFADPVNLGTFLFAGTVAAWYVRRPWVMLMGVVGSALAVSKGAALGVLVLAAIWVREHRSRFEYAVMVALVVVAGLGFYGFTTSNSTGSTTAHVNGFLAAFTELPRHPLGRGLGGTGVLAGLFSEGGDSAIVESGIGMILGQLGVVGLATYGLFFFWLITTANLVADHRARTLALGLTLAFLANAAFNEVALSPNSAAPYFVIIGLVLGTATLRERPKPPARQVVMMRNGAWAEH